MACSPSGWASAAGRTLAGVKGGVSGRLFACCFLADGAGSLWSESGVGQVAAWWGWCRLVFCGARASMSDTVGATLRAGRALWAAGAPGADGSQRSGSGEWMRRCCGESEPGAREEGGRTARERISRGEGSIGKVKESGDAWEGRMGLVGAGLVGAGLVGAGLLVAVCVRRWSRLFYRQTLATSNYVICVSGGRRVFELAGLPDRRAGLAQLSRYALARYGAHRRRLMGAWRASLRIWRPQASPGVPRACARHPITESPGTTLLASRRPDFQTIIPDATPGPSP
ncbi:hypothetical protein JB92DRAFT_1236545 [Gautieria morchelliformis]|nr:hypothetical protein JB92DRAFT_1236545 [Gautieria morchelliformis]